MMDCFRPFAPSDEELLRHSLDGDNLSPESKEHIEQCTICHQRLARYISTNRQLLSELYRCECPDAATLSHYCVDMLSLDTARSVASHLKVCPLCTREVDDTFSMLKSFEPFPEGVVFPSKPPATPWPDFANLVPWQPQHIMSFH